MSDTLRGVIIGAILTGIFLVGAQFLTGIFLIGVQLLSAKNQADAARDAWNRNQKAQRHAELESMSVEILRYIQEIEYAVSNFEAGGTNMTPDQFVDTVNAAGRAVMLSGYSLIVRKGPEDPTPPLIGRVVDEARAFSGLYLIGRNPPATAAQKHEQALVVSAAATALRTHIHAMVKADADSA